MSIWTKLFGDTTSKNETQPKSADERKAALNAIIEELTGFIGTGPTRRSTNVINLESRDDMLDRLSYYRGWIEEGTFPKLTLYVLDATTKDVRFPHLMILTGPLDQNIALLQDNDYQTRVKKYVSKGRLAMADSYQDFDIPGFTNANRLNLDFSRKVLQPGYYVVSRIFRNP